MICNRLVLLIVLLSVCASLARPPAESKARDRNVKALKRTKSKGASADAPGQEVANLNKKSKNNTTEGKGNGKFNDNKKSDSSQMRINMPQQQGNIKMNDMTQQRPSAPSMNPTQDYVKMPQPMGSLTTVNKDKMQQGYIPMSQGSMDQGSMGQDSMSQGSMGQGSMGQGSVRYGSRGSTSNDANKIKPIIMSNNNPQMQPSSMLNSKSGLGDAKLNMEPSMSKDSDRFRSDGVKPLVKGDNMPTSSIVNSGSKTAPNDVSVVKPNMDLIIGKEIERVRALESSSSMSGVKSGPVEGQNMKPIMDGPPMMKDADKSKMSSSMNPAVSKLGPSMASASGDVKLAMDDKMKQDMEKTGGLKKPEEYVKSTDIKSPLMSGNNESLKPLMAHSAVNIPKEEAMKAMAMAKAKTPEMAMVKAPEMAMKSPEDIKKMPMPGIKVAEISHKKPINDDEEEEEDE